MSVADAGGGTASIDPRLRARRIAVRRDEGRRRLQRLVGLGVLAAVVLVAIGVTRSPVLDVDGIRVEGAAHTSPDAVAQATGIRRNSPMTDVDLDRARAGVLSLPWVQTVSIERQWPSDIAVVITERTPVAVVTAGTAGFALVDAEGRVLETTPEPTPGFVLLANVPAPGPPGTMLDPSATSALEVARVLPPSIAPLVSTVAVDGEDVTLRVATGGVVRLGPANDLAAKLRATATVLRDADLTDLCAIDVRVPSVPSLTRGEGCL